MATPYQRLARETPAYAWWKLPVAGVVIATTYMVLSVVLLIGAAVYFAAAETGTASLDGWLDNAGELDLDRLDFFVLDMLGLAILIPAVFLGVLATGPRPVGFLSSVTGRLRWRWLGRTVLISSAVFAATFGALLAVTELLAPDEVDAPSDVDGRVVTAIVLVLLIVPFQAAAEEYLFRGYLMQLVGSWSRHAFVPVVVTTPLFVAGHAYELWGLVDVAIFGVTAAVLTIRTGGLEAAIAAHTVNNVLLLSLDALGMISATGGDDPGPVDLLPTVVTSILLLVLVERSARRAGIQRTRPPIPPAPPPEAPMWPPPPYAMVWGAAPQQWVPAPPPAPVRLHPQTPDYPGDLPPGWRP